MDDDMETQRQHASTHATDIQPEKGDANENPIPLRRKWKLQKLKRRNTDWDTTNEQYEDDETPSNEQVSRKRDALTTFRTIASQCELPDSTEIRAEKLFDGLDSDFRMAFGTTGVALAVCIYAANEVHQRWSPNEEPDKPCFLKDISKEIGVHPALPYRRLVIKWGEP